LIGSLEDTQEVLDLCALHGIGPDIEIIDIDAINQAFKKVEDGAVRFRYVIDMASLTADGRRTTTEADAGNTDAAGTPAESSEAEPIIEGALLL
jgi:hypothetical protein